MKPAVKIIYILPLLFILMHLPYAFGRPVTNINIVSPAVANLPGEILYAGSANVLYDSLQLDEIGLGRQAFDQAVAGWEQLVAENRLSNPGILAIADFTQSSNQRRLYVLDMKNYQLLFHTLVAHGRNSGKEFATQFSNKISSNKSSPGFYITGQTYHGGNGYSLKLDGIEKGINDKAFQRAIVIHGADYVSSSRTASMGFIGRSQGCPAVPMREARPIINTLKEGACFYIYTSDQQYYSRSLMLNNVSRG